MYGLFLGLNLAKEMKITKIVIFGDSLLIIQYLYRGSFPKYNKLKILLHRIMVALDYFHFKNFFHILKSQDREANKKSNLVGLLKMGEININDLLGC